MIPEEAIEAAAEWLPHSDDCEVRPERDCTCWLPRVNLMRAALEAAAPFLRAQALEDAAEEFNSRLPDGTGNGRAYNSYRVAELLRARAVTERGRE